LFGNLSYHESGKNLNGKKKFKKIGNVEAITGFRSLIAAGNIQLGRPAQPQKGRRVKHQNTEDNWKNRKQGIGSGLLKQPPRICGILEYLEDESDGRRKSQDR